MPLNSKRKKLKSKQTFWVESPACLMLQLKTSGYAFCGKQSSLRMKDESKCSCFSSSHWRLIWSSPFFSFLCASSFFVSTCVVLLLLVSSYVWLEPIRIIKSIWRGSGGKRVVRVTGATRFFRSPHRMPILYWSSFLCKKDLVLRTPEPKWGYEFACLSLLITSFLWWNRTSEGKRKKRTKKKKEPEICRRGFSLPFSSPMQYTCTMRAGSLCSNRYNLIRWLDERKCCERTVRVRAKGNWEVRERSVHWISPTREWFECVTERRKREKAIVGHNLCQSSRYECMCECIE